MGKLWVFTHPDLTVYTIRANRSSDVVLDILGEHFACIVTSDGFLAYDDRRLQDWLKQKCLSHLLKDLKEMNETKTGRALHFARQATSLLQEAFASHTFSQRARDLEERRDTLIAFSRHFSDPDNARFAKRLRKHRPPLLRFLYVDDLEPTNNPAERMLRPTPAVWLYSAFPR